MSRRLDIFIHQPARNARETRRVVVAQDSRSFADSIGALIGGEHRPEGKHAKNTPLVADAEEVTYKGFSIEKGSGSQSMYQTYFPGGSSKKLPMSGSLEEAKRKVDDYLKSQSA